MENKVLKIFDRAMYMYMARALSESAFGGYAVCHENGLTIEVEQDARDDYFDMVTDADGNDCVTDFDSGMMSAAVDEFRRREEESEFESEFTYDILRRAI
ncbi:MAG: hypothetical protein LBV41_02995 [Cytophagaceae bacterium]|jgi:hypothetical protein|nr:hypothetical protein [Cytophagaceae bacterium]